MNIGIDIGGSHIAVGLVNNSLEIIDKKEYNWKKEEKINFTDSIEKYCKKLIKDLISENDIIKIEKIGIGYPYKDIKDGIVYIHGKSFDLISKLKEEFNVPVYLKNDVKCSALCEKKMGNLKNYDNCLFMTLGTGIGGAYFYKNELVVPNKYPGFEVGHITIQINGKECRCGKKGCFEEYASMRVFRKAIEELFGIEKLTSYKMYEIIESKEKQKEVNDIIDTYVEYLSVGIGSLISVLEPDAICIGGSFAYYESIFMEKLKRKLQISLLNRTIPDILIAKYENDAGIIGASMLESN